MWKVFSFCPFRKDSPNNIVFECLQVIKTVTTRVGLLPRKSVALIFFFFEHGNDTNFPLKGLKYFHHFSFLCLLSPSTPEGILFVSLLKRLPQPILFVRFQVVKYCTVTQPSWVAFLLAWSLTSFYCEFLQMKRSYLFRFRKHRTSGFSCSELL